MTNSSTSLMRYLIHPSNLSRPPKYRATRSAVVNPTAGNSTRALLDLLLAIPLFGCTARCRKQSRSVASHFARDNDHPEGSHLSVRIAPLTLIFLHVQMSSIIKSL